ALIERRWRNLQAQQDVLKLADSRLRREDAADVEAKRRGELEPRPDENAIEQAPVLGERLLLVWPDAPKFLQIFKLLNFLDHRAVSGHGVVVGERDDVEATLLGLMQNVQVRYAGLLVIGRPRRMQ